MKWSSRPSVIQRAGSASEVAVSAMHACFAASLWESASEQGQPSLLSWGLFTQDTYP